MIDLNSVRSKFSSIQDNIHLYSHSLGPMPDDVNTNLARYTDTWSRFCVKAWEEEWWMLNTTLGNVAADIINVPHSSVSIQHNVTSATALMLSCFNFSGKRNRVIYSDMHFPSIRYLLESFLPDTAEHVVIKSEDGITVPAEKIADAIDDRTLVVPICHAYYRSSYLQDIKPITAKARKHGAHVILDIYQSAGVVPIDVQQMDVDVAIGGSIKWLCGGPGAAYLYVRPEFAKTVTPGITGWIAHENPFDFADRMKYADSPDRRFLTGTPHIPALYAAKAGFELIRDIGVDNIREHSVKLTTRLIDKALENGIRIQSPLDPEKRGGTVVLDIHDGYAIAEELVKRKFLVDWRPQAGIRVSPHIFTTEDEIDIFMEELLRLI